MTPELAAAVRATTTEALNGTFDALVVGAGAAGGLAAQLLCEAGLRVLVLDAGFRPPALQAPFRRLTQSLVGRVADPRAAQILPPRVVHKGRMALRALGRFRQPVQTQCYAWERLPQAFVDDLDCPYVTPPGRPFAWIRAMGLGGRMIVPGHGRQYYRLAAEDFARDDGLSPRWPLKPGELDPWYAMIERRLRLFGSRDGVPSLPDSEIATGLEPTQYEAEFTSAVRARWPEARVVLGRFAPPLATLDAAAATGRLLCRTGAIARRIEIAPSGHVSGVAWYDRIERREMRARTPLVFLCASALESTRILLMSETGRGEPLGAALAALGRHLMDHVMVKAEGVGPALPGEPFAPPDGRCLYLPRFDLRDGGPGEGRGYGVQVYLSPADSGRSYFTGVAFSEMTPRAGNRVTLDPERRDAWGAPVLRIDCTHSDEERSRAREQARALREIAALSGATLAKLADEPATPGLAVHECGTARMGEDPANSVLDPHNQCWEAEGLYVTDGAAFPSQGNQNPTLTIMALTARACDHALRASGGRIAGAAGE